MTKQLHSKPIKYQKNWYNKCILANSSRATGGPDNPSIWQSLTPLNQDKESPSSDSLLHYRTRE